MPMKTRTFLCPKCSHKQKFYHVITEANFSSWECPNCGSRIKYDTSISIPTSVAIVLGLMLILHRFDPPFWIGCLFGVVYIALALILFYKTFKIKLLRNENN